MRGLAMVALLLLAGAARGWDCVCNPRECEPLEPSGCPGRGMVVWDPCKYVPLRPDCTSAGNLRCCKVCARTIGEDCGEFKGTCERGLECIAGTCTPLT